MVTVTNLRACTVSKEGHIRNITGTGTVTTTGLQELASVLTWKTISGY
jgi:hypothetical protein